MFCKSANKNFIFKDGFSIDVEKHMQVNGVAGNFLGSNEKKVNNQNSWKNRKSFKRVFGSLINIIMGILEKIADIEKEIAKTQKNKGKEIPIIQISNKYF